MKAVILLILFKVLAIDGNCRSISNIDFNNVPIENLFVPNPAIIDGTVTTFGVITSTNYPGDYNTNEQCGYIIKAPAGSRIRLEFTGYDINTEARFGVLDGNSSPFGGTYTEFPIDTSAIPPPFESTANMIGINFSVGGNSAMGWRLVYSIIDRRSKENPLIFIDSGTSTIMLAAAFVLGLFFLGFSPS